MNLRLKKHERTNTITKRSKAMLTRKNWSEMKWNLKTAHRIVFPFVCVLLALSALLKLFAGRIFRKILYTHTTYIRKLFFWIEIHLEWVQRLNAIHHIKHLHACMFMVCERLAMEHGINRFSHRKKNSELWTPH